jgi:radical SAM superfamily enzyme YgiQ (UPF0313 family)
VLDADPDLGLETDVKIHHLRGGWSITQMARMIFGDGDIPDVLAFSVLGWNYRTFACLAELFKQLRPDGITVFGGNHVGNQGRKVFRACPSVDIVVNGGGEPTFRDLTAALLTNRREPDLTGTAGLSFHGRAK